MNGELKVELVELYSVGAACADLDVEAAKQSKFGSASSIFGFAGRVDIHNPQSILLYCSS